MLETSPIILFFYSPKISFEVAYYSCIIPRFCIPQVQNRPQNIEAELHAQSIMAHKGIPKLVAPYTVYNCTVHCTTVYM